MGSQDWGYHLPWDYPKLFHLISCTDLTYRLSVHQHHPSLPAQILYQDVEQHVEVVSDPKGLKADAPEVVGGKHIHHSKDHKQQHSCHACERKSWETLWGRTGQPHRGSNWTGKRCAHPKYRCAGLSARCSHLESSGRTTSNTSVGAVTWRKTRDCTME